MAIPVTSLLPNGATSCRSPVPGCCISPGFSACGFDSDRRERLSFARISARPRLHRRPLSEGQGARLVLLLPFIQEMVRVDLRVQVIEIPTQDVISRDNVSMKVDAVPYFFNVVNPERAIIQVQDHLPAANMLAQTTLRAVLGQHELDEMLSERKKLSTDVQSIIDSQTETWGIKVRNVEIRTVELTENMVRAIAKQAEAERDRRARIFHAEAEFQASQTLVNAAKNTLQRSARHVSSWQILLQKS